MPVASIALVRSFLDHMQARDLVAAARLLAPDFAMHFPGTPAMHELRQLVQWSAGRYRSVAKDYAGFDESRTEDGAIVYCHGSLHGVWLDGSAFSNIRFIDRFEIVNGLIRRQDVWNDMALQQAAKAQPS